MMPTPLARSGGSNKGGGGSRNEHIRRPSLKQLSGGINYALREWMLGLPVGWTGQERLEMRKFQEWRKSHGAFSHLRKTKMALKESGGYKAGDAEAALPLSKRKANFGRHLSKTVHYGTPPDIVAAARVALGGAIDLDPATSERFNALHIQARKIYTKETNGLRRKWKARRLILNPPGGKVDEEGNPIASKNFGFSSAGFWFDKLMDQVKKGYTEKAIFVAFTLEFLQTMQTNGHDLTGMHICIPKKRLCFLSRKGVPLKQPTHSNAVIGIGISKNDFYKAFREIGICSTID